MEILERFFSEKRPSVPEQALPAFHQVQALTLRGGKRLRTRVAEAGHFSIKGTLQAKSIQALGAVFELLQTHLLIQDDWMDQDAVRRGGPSVHRALAEHTGQEHLGHSLAILASDLALAYAHQLLAEVPFPPNLERESLQTFHRAYEEVVLGQTLDMCGSKEVDRVYDLKTTSYTVRAPLLLGAMLADGDDAQRQVLARVSEHMGLAFQLRDEWIGLFGDPKQTGKPVGNDLVQGKETYLLHLAREGVSQSQRNSIDGVFRNQGATTQQREEAMRAVRASGAEVALEDRIASLESRIVDELNRSELHTERLMEVTRMLLQRDR